MVVLVCIAMAATDPPFYVYPYLLAILMTVTVQSILWPCHTWPWKQTVGTLIPMYGMLFLLFHHLAATTEVQRTRSHSFDTGTSNSGGGGGGGGGGDVRRMNTNGHFYYMQTVAADYDAAVTAKIHAISDFVNSSDKMQSQSQSRHNHIHIHNHIHNQQKKAQAQGSTITTTPTPASSEDNRIEPLPVSSVKLFDNAIRFDFLLEFVANDDFTADFACLIESDVVIHTQYFREEWYKAAAKGVEFMYVQHMWARTDFEAHNVGCLCVSKTASRQTIQWLKWMSYWNDRRYCRLLIKPLLYSKWMGLPDSKQHVLAWDRDGGCTVLRQYCHYIHFTRPKGPALDAAMAIVKRGSFDS
jgi:hypothetical protein